MASCLEKIDAVFSDDYVASDSADTLVGCHDEADVGKAHYNVLGEALSNRSNPNTVLRLGLLPFPPTHQTQSWAQ